MPRVENYGLRTVEGAPAGGQYQDIRVPAGAFQVGSGAMAGLAGVLDDVDKHLTERQDQMRQQEMETAAADADNQLSAGLSDIGSNYFTLQGKSAYDGFAAASKAAADQKVAVLARIKDPATADLVGRAADIRIGNLTAQMQQHRNQQFGLYQDSVSDARIDQAYRNIADFYNDPKQIDLNRHVIQSELTDRFMRKGEPDLITGAIREMDSRIAFTAIQAAAAQDPQLARHMLERTASTPSRAAANGAAADISGGDTATATPTNAALPGMVVAASESTTGDSTANESPTSDARAGGGSDLHPASALTPSDHKNATRIVSAAEQQRRVTTRADLEQRINDQHVAALGGQAIAQPVTLADLQQHYSPAAATQILKGLGHDQQLGQVLKSYTFATQDDLMKVARAPAPAFAAGEPAGPAISGLPYAGGGYAQAVQDHAVTSEAARLILQQRAADPAGYVLQAMPDLADQMADPRTRDQAFARTLNLQTQMGVPLERQHVLSKQQASDVVTEIRGNAGPEAQLAALIAYVGQGPETQRARVVGDLMEIKNGLPKMTPAILDQAAIPEQQLRARQLFSEVLTPTDGITPDAQGLAAIRYQATNGLGRIMLRQQQLTGSAASLQRWQDYRDTLLHVATIRGTAGGDYARAAETAAGDLSGGLAMIDDDDFAAVFYPQNYEAQRPHAIEHGLLALRHLSQAEIDARLPQMELTPETQALLAREAGGEPAYIAEHGTWINSGRGFALVLPNADPARPGYGILKEVSYDAAFQAGLRDLDENKPKPFSYRSPSYRSPAAVR